MGVRFNNSAVIALTVLGLVGIAAVIPTAAVATIKPATDDKVTESETTVELVVPTVSVEQPEIAVPPYEQDMTYSAKAAQANTTTTTTTTTVAVAPPPAPPAELKCPQWQQTAIDVGWPVDALPMLDRVMYRESRCNIDSWNRSDPAGGSRGLMQINGYWCEINKYNPIGWLQEQGILTTCEDLFDPAINLRSALAIWQRSGWGPWGF